MENRYTNRQLYFNEQSFTTATFVIPYIEKVTLVTADKKILEIGCGEGGNLKPFLDLGCTAVGIDINAPQIEQAHVFLDAHPQHAKLRLIASDIYLINEQDIGKFDIIYMRDVIEHIPNQEKFLGHIQQFLQPDGIVYFGFPPWQMPFGGHQQATPNKIISKLPFIHILPRFIYRFILKIFGVDDNSIIALMEIKDTGITIERFKRIVKKNNYAIVDETMFFINPNYEIKFKLKTRKLPAFLTKLPFIRNFYTTCCYYIIRQK